MASNEDIRKSVRGNFKKDNVNDKKLGDKPLSTIDNFADSDSGSYEIKDKLFVGSNTYKPAAEIQNEHFYDYNAAKECMIWVGGRGKAYSPDLDWRLAKNNGFVEVNKAVRLFTQEENVEMSYSLELSKAEAPKFAGGFVDAATSLLDAVATLAPEKVGGRAVKYISAFDEPVIYKSLTNLKMGSELKFSFNFGSAGLYSGLEEVVKPIYAFASLLAPADADGAMAVGGGFYRPPLPTNSAWNATFLKSSIQTLGDKVDSLKPKAGEDGSPGRVSNAQSAIDAAFAVQNAYFDMIHSGAKNIFAAANVGYEKNKYKLFHIQLGHLKIGPCTVKEIKMNFDTSNLDSEGWPISGSLTLGGIETFTKAVRPVIQGSLIDDEDFIPR